MADMNLFSGFQSALSGAGGGLISASKDVESYIQNIYQDTADDISERKKLFKNLVEKIGIAEDKGIKNILDRYEEFEKEAIALSSKEENRNQKKYSETLQQISLIQGTVQKAMNEAFRQASKTTKDLISQIHKTTSIDALNSIIKEARASGITQKQLERINLAAQRKSEKKIFKEVAGVFRKATGAQFEAVKAFISGFRQNLNDELTESVDQILDGLDRIVKNSGSDSITRESLIKMVEPAFKRSTKLLKKGQFKKVKDITEAVSIFNEGLNEKTSEAFKNLADSRVDAIFSGFKGEEGKSLKRLIDKNQGFDFREKLRNLQRIAETQGRRMAIEINEQTNEFQISFLQKSSEQIQKAIANGQIRTKAPFFNFSARGADVARGVLSRNGMATPNDIVMYLGNDQKDPTKIKTIVTTTANMVLDGVADALKESKGLSDEELMYRIKKAVNVGYRGASSESTKFFEEEFNDLRNGISQGRIMNMGGRINVVPAFSEILKAMKRANIDVGTTSQYYDSKVFEDLFSVVEAYKKAGRDIERLKSNSKFGYLFKDDGVSKMVLSVIRPLSELPMAVGQGSTAQIKNGYIQLAANWQRAASFLPGDTSKHLSQGQNYEMPVGGKRSFLPPTKVRTMAGKNLGFDYEALSERLYNIQYVTEERLLKEWDEWLDTESGKEYLSKGGSKILPGLHDSASIYRSDLEDDFKTKRYRYKRVSANEWFKTQRDLGLAGKLSGLSEDDVAKAIISKIMGVNVKNISDLTFGQMGIIDEGESRQDPTKDFTFGFNEIVDWMGNPKGLGAETGTRSAMMPIVSKFITDKFGENIHMLRLAEEMGSNDFGGMIIGAIQHKLVSGMSAEKIVEAIDKNTSLKGLFEAEGGNLYLKSDMRSTRSLDLNKVKKELESALEIKFGEDLIISEAVNSAHDYLYQKDTKYGQRELESMRRTIATARFQSQKENKDIDFSEFLAHEEATVVDKKRKEAADKLAEQYAKAFRASFGSRELESEITDILPSDFSDKDTKFAFNTDQNLGLIDYENWENSALASIYKKIEESGGKYGRINLADILPPGFKPIKHSDGFGKEWTMSSLVIPNVPHESDTAFFDETYRTGVSLTEFDKALNTVIRTVEEYNSIAKDQTKTEEEKEKARTYLSDKLNQNLEDFYRTNYAYFTSKDSQIAQDRFYNRVEGSHSFMAAGLNEAQRNKFLSETSSESEKMLGKILDESYLIGPEAMRELIGNNIEDIKAQYEYIFDKAPDVKLTKEKMLDQIIEAMTIENIGTDTFKNKGLFSKDLRFPSIQGQDVRYIRGFVTNSLKGNLETAYMGSSAAAANRTDYDRDHVNLLSVLRNIGSVNVKEYLRAADAVTKLHEAVSANIRDVRNAQGGKINGEVSFFDDKKEVTSEDLSSLAAVVALRNRGQIGLLSSQATEMRNFLSANNLDELASGTEVSGVGQLVRYAFEKAEQDAISYKHVIKRLAENKLGGSGASVQELAEADRKQYVDYIDAELKKISPVYTIEDLIKKKNSMTPLLPGEFDLKTPLESLADEFDIERYQQGKPNIAANAEDVMKASLQAMTELENVVSKAWEKDGGYDKTSTYFRELQKLGIFGKDVDGVPFIEAMTQAYSSGGEKFEEYIEELSKKFGVDANAILMKRKEDGSFVTKELDKLGQMPFEMLMQIIDDTEEIFKKSNDKRTLLQRALVSANRTLGDEAQSDYVIGKFLRTGGISGKTEQKDVSPETKKLLDLTKQRVKRKTGYKGSKDVLGRYLYMYALTGASDADLISAIETVDVNKAKELLPRVEKSIEDQAQNIVSGERLDKVRIAPKSNISDWELFAAELVEEGHVYKKILDSSGKKADLGVIKSASQLGSFFRGDLSTEAIRKQDEDLEKALSEYGGTNFSIQDLIGDNYSSQDIKAFENLRRKKIASDFGTLQHKEIEILGNLLENPPAGFGEDEIAGLLEYNSGTTFEGKIKSVIEGNSELKMKFTKDLQELKDKREKIESNLAKFGYDAEDIQKFQNAALFSTLAQTQIVRNFGLKNVAREYSLGMETTDLGNKVGRVAGTIDQIYYDETKKQFVIGDSKNKSGSDALSQVLQISYGAMALRKLIQRYGDAKESNTLEDFKKQFSIEESFASAIEDVLNKDLDDVVSGIITKFDTKGGFVKAYRTTPLKDEKMADLLYRFEYERDAMTPEERSQVEKYQAEIMTGDSRVYADNPQDFVVFKYDEAINKALVDFKNAIIKRVELQKRLLKLEQADEKNSIEYNAVSAEIEKLNSDILEKQGGRYTHIGKNEEDQKMAKELEEAANKSVKTYEADSAYNDVVKGISEERKLQSEVFKLKKQKSALEKEDAKANEATIKEIEEVLKSYQQSIDSIKSYREQLKELYGDKWNEDAGDGKPTKFEDIKTREKLTELLGARDKKLLADAETNSATKEYIALLNQQLQLELKIKGFQRDAATSRGRQKELDLLAAEAYNEQLEETNKNLEKIDKSKVKNIDSINAENELKRNSALASLYAKKPYSNIFEYIKADIGRATQRIVDFGLAAKVLNTARKEIQQVYQNILKLDEAMTNLRIVTGANTEQAKSMMNAYNDLAMQLGTTTQAVAQSAAEWLRQGYSVSEANELIKSSTYLSRLGFMDMGQSVTALTSVMKGFRIEATDSMDIVDKLTQLDAKYATTAGDIATALSRTSAVAREAGLDLDQTAAALTTMIDVSQQDASSVGNAFRTILARYGNVKATAFTSLVGDSEDVDETNSSINDTEKVLGAIGIKIRSSSSDMRDFDDVMDELADKWVTLTDVEKNAVSTALAGKFMPVCGLKHTQRTHLIAGKTLEPFTTIIKKLDYDGLKNKRIGRSAAKLLNEYFTRRTFNDHPPMRGILIMLQEYGANKGVGENPLNGNGVTRYENTGLRNGLFLRESVS